MDNEREITVEVVALCGFVGGKDFSDPVDALVAHKFKKVVGLLPCFRVGGILEPYLRRHTRRMAVSLPVLQSAVRVYLHKSVTGEHNVRLHVADDIDLTVVGYEEEVRLFKGPGFTCRVDKVVEPSLGVLHALCDVFIEYAVFVAVVVDVAGVEHKQVRLIHTENVAAYVYEELIGLRVAADLEAVDMLIDDLVPEFLRCSASAECLVLCVIGALRPVLGKVVVDVLVTSRYGPEGVRGGKTGFLCRREDIGDLHRAAEPVPRYTLEHTRMEFRVICDTVLAGIATGHHRRVAGIGYRGIDRAHLANRRALLKQLFEHRLFEKIFHILPDHRVAGKNNNSAL